MEGAPPPAPLTAGVLGASKKLIPAVTISDNPSEVFCVRFSPDGKFLAAGCGDGAIRVFNTSTGKLSYNLNVAGGSEMPCTSVRFRPAGARTKNVLLSVNSDGGTQYWHITSGKCLHSISAVDNNQLYAVDYRNDGQMFATAGKDYAVRVYDEATKSLTATLAGGRITSASSPGHSNRIFSVKFCPVDDNILLSAGWDNTVQIWDLRAGMSVRSIFGPHICGDSLDMSDTDILTGSWRPEDPLETWDFGTGKLIEKIPWHQTLLKGEPCMLYAAQFSKGGDGKAGLIAAGGSGANECKVFDRTGGNKVVGTVAGLSRGVFSLDFNHDGTKLAVAGGDAAIRLIDIVDAE